MTNAEIARVLQEIADLLSICNENVFKIRSYERAAEAVGGTSVSVEDLASRGELQTLPGIGKSIEEVITELVTVGDCQYRQQLLAQAPEGLLEMLRIPGFGPKKAGLVYRELGIASITELEAAAREGRLKGLPGFGSKTETKILAGLEQLKAGTERALLGSALPLAEALVDAVRGQAAVIAAEMAGSARRRRETVGDLDILATSADPAAVCKWFATAGQLAEVELAGETKVSGRTVSGLKVDLRVLAPESFGAALQYFTGSQQHNIRLRERAQKRGLTISEYGVFEGEPGQKGRQVAGETEESVYEAVGLPWIPPELREDRGEIEAAEEGRLPRLVEVADFRTDLHLHTEASDGHMTLEQLAETGCGLGYTHLGITNHSQALVIANGLDRDALLRQIEQIRKLNEHAQGCMLLAGTEADILIDGSLDVPEDVWPELDFAIGSIHSGFSGDVDKMTSRVVRALKSGRIDILGHPTGRLILGRKGYDLHLEEVIAAAVEHQVALEINASPYRLDLSDVNARLAVSKGALLSINTDAHYREELQLLKYGVMTARRGWVEAESVINTWELGRLRGWLAERRKKEKSHSKTSRRATHPR
ncbi:MAG: DNA polymerase/3'-5' exonuclease PolX [Armatimonadia bacterium]